MIVHKGSYQVWAVSMTYVSKCNSERCGKRGVKNYEDIGREGLGGGWLGSRQSRLSRSRIPPLTQALNVPQLCDTSNQPRRSLIHLTRHLSNEMSEFWSPKDLANMLGMPIIERKVRKRAAPGRFAGRLQDTRNVAPCRMKTRLHPQYRPSV